MCECYQIGGRFIAEDPDCPVHGYAAQAEQKARGALIDNIVGELEELQTKTGEDTTAIIAKVQSLRYFD